MNELKARTASRFSDIDIVKILAVMLVPSLHFFENCGFVGEPYINFSMVLQETIRWISFSCIGLFLLSTGYLQCNRSPGKYGKIVKYIIPYFIYCLLTVIVLHGLNVRTFSNIFYYFLQFPAYFWYMSFYYGFYLLIPYLNMITKNMEKRQFQILILTLFIVVSLPNFVNSLPALWGSSKYIYLPSWWSDFFPVVYYFIGVYFRRYQPHAPRFLLAGIVLVASFGVSLLDFVYSKGGNPKFFGGGYGSALTVVIAVCLFMLFYDVNVRQKTARNILCFISNTTLNVYLGLVISDRISSTVMRHFFSAWLREYHFKLYFVEVPVNFLAALMIAVIYALLELLIKRVWRGSKNRKTRENAVTV